MFSVPMRSENTFYGLYTAEKMFSTIRVVLLCLARVGLSYLGASSSADVRIGAISL
jgi:hypothetical protein